MPDTNTRELRLYQIAARGEIVKHFRLMDSHVQLFNHRDPMALADLELYAEMMERREHHYNRLQAQALADQQDEERSADRAREAVLSLTLTILAILLTMPAQVIRKVWNLLGGGR